jgi:hypothetical protein
MRLGFNGGPITNWKRVASSSVLGALAALVMFACAPKGQPPAPAGESADGTADSSGGQAAPLDDHRITAGSMGAVWLGMTLDEARQVLPQASFARQHDGDGQRKLSTTLRGPDRAHW